MYFYGSNLGPPGPEPSWTLGPSFEQTWWKTTRQCYIPNFKHLSHVVLKKKIFLIYFYKFLWFKPRTPWRVAILDPGTFVWTNLVKGHQKCNIQNFKHLSQAVLEKKIFKYFSFLNPRPPLQGHFRPQDHHLNKLGTGPLGNATYQISKP